MRPGPSIPSAKSSMTATIFVEINVLVYRRDSALPDIIAVHSATQEA